MRVSFFVAICKQDSKRKDCCFFARLTLRQAVAAGIDAQLHTRVKMDAFFKNACAALTLARKSLLNHSVFAIIEKS